MQRAIDDAQGAHRGGLEELRRADEAISGVILGEVGGGTEEFLGVYGCVDGVVEDDVFGDGDGFVLGDVVVGV